MEQGLAGPGHPPALIAVVFAVVVADHALDSLKSVPADIGRILVAEADLPLGHGQRLLDTSSGIGPRDASGPAVDEGTRVGGVLEDGQDGRDGRPPPDQIAEAVAPGQQQVAAIEELHDPTRRLDLEEGGEDQLEPALDLLVGMFDHPPQRVADQPDRQGQGQFAALSLVEESGRQAGAQGMELQFGDQALEPQDQSAIGRGRVVDAVLVTDEQERYPHKSSS